MYLGNWDSERNDRLHADARVQNYLLTATSCMLTQMTVDLNDPPFADQPNQLADFEEAARELAEKFRWIVKPDGQHFQNRVVPNPRPTGIVEHDAIA